jgi:hypothetical protein
MDSIMSLTEHVDITVGNTLTMLRFVKRLSSVFRDPYILKSLHVSLVPPKPEYTDAFL